MNPGDDPPRQLGEMMQPEASQLRSVIAGAQVVRCAVQRTDGWKRDRQRPWHARQKLEAGEQP